MTRLATTFVLAYHGCDKSVADRVLSGDTKLLQSKRQFDWLGPGAYFWESDPQRAQEWAEWKAKRGDYKKPTVIGAAIDLGNCLDLITRQDLELVKAAHASLQQTLTKAGLPMPENKSPEGRDEPDRLLRYLDCAVITHLHESMVSSDPSDASGIAPFDTVRGMFTEGAPLYDGCGFLEKSHVQIAVRNNTCIKGVFVPR